MRWIVTTPILAFTVGNDGVALEALSLAAAIGEELVECSRTTKETRQWEDGETFERFTDRARRVLVLAQEEARLFNHGFIGTEHILLGLIHEGEGVAAKALGLLGISLTAARAKVEETVGIAAGAPSGSPPFTPRAKKVLELSLREALQLGHSYIGTEHLLLGVVREGEGVAAQVLVSLGADLGRVRQQVIQLMSGYQRGDALGAPTGTSRWKMAGRGNLAVGCRCSAEVVVAGRGPTDFAAAYDRLVELARRLGLDGVNESRLHLSSVDTDDGPGLRLSVIHELPPEEAEEQDDQPDAPSSGEESPPTPLADDERGSAEESDSGEIS